MHELIAIYRQFQVSEKRALVLTTILWTLWSLLRIAIIALTVLLIREILIPGYRMTTIHYFWGALIGVFVLKGAVFSGANHIAHLAGFAMVGRLRQNFVDHLKALPLGFFTKERLGHIATIAHSDINRVQYAVSHLWTKLISDLLVSLLVAVALFILDWRLGLALISLLPAAFLFLWRAVSKGEAIQKQVRDHMSEMVSSFVEYTKGIPVLKTFSENPVIAQKLWKQIAAFGRSSKRASVFTFKHIGGYLFFLELCFGVVVAAGAHLFLGNAIPLYVYAVFIMLGREFYKPFLSAEVYLFYYVVLKDSSRRIETVMQTPAIRAAANPLVPKNHDIHFDQVSFNYERNGFTMKDINFAAGEGTITALVGPSGSGKTTIANLLVRFWDVDNGAIKVGGIDIRDIEYDELLSRISIVMQDVILFNDTIYENIRLGKRNATKEEIVQAAKSAMIHAFIIALPDGYETNIGENASKLSGGEKQRISIARMILEDAPIVILDEMTSAIDPINERKIQQAVNNLVRGKTTLVIAHHLYTIRHADQIIVLDEGRIVEKGKHAELLALNRMYKRLWEAQSQAKGWKVIG